MSVTIYHNPRCSKSRQTLELLSEKSVDTNIVEYLKTPPTSAELAQILDKLGLQPRQLMRKNEAEYKASGADNETLSQQQLIDIMIANPKLIERPIVINGDKATIGRPPVNVLDII